MLSDNIFYGGGLSTTLQRAANAASGSPRFRVSKCATPKPMGSSNLTRSGKAIAIEEKPCAPALAMGGDGTLTFCDNAVGEIAASSEPSARGEIRTSTTSISK